MWLYNNEPIKPEQLNGHKSFVYQITCLINGKIYIGKKKLFFTRMKRVKDKKRRIRQIKDSDWEEYWGSSEALAKDLVTYGKDNFTREILYLCESNAEATYYELYEQLYRHVLLHPARYYNNFVGAKIHRNHVLKNKEI